MHAWFHEAGHQLSKPFLMRDEFIPLISLIDVVPRCSLDNQSCETREYTSDGRPRPRTVATKSHTTPNLKPSILGAACFAGMTRLCLTFSDRKKNGRGPRMLLPLRGRKAIVLPERFDTPHRASTISLSPWSTGEGCKVLQWISFSVQNFFIFPSWPSALCCGFPSFPFCRHLTGRALASFSPFDKTVIPKIQSPLPFLAKNAHEVPNRAHAR